MTTSACPPWSRTRSPSAAAVAMVAYRSPREASSGAATTVVKAMAPLRLSSPTASSAFAELQPWHCCQAVGNALGNSTAIRDVATIPLLLLLQRSCRTVPVLKAGVSRVKVRRGGIYFAHMCGEVRQVEEGRTRNSRAVRTSVQSLRICNAHHCQTARGWRQAPQTICRSAAPPSPVVLALDPTESARPVPM